MCQTSKMIERNLKNWTIFVKRASIKLMTSFEQGKHLLFQIQPIGPKQH